jgi:NAD(P)-dependent dehydrogenase (short-subunit alcohol dehydrogenase family)
VTVTDVLQLLRPGLLEGRQVVLSRPARPEIEQALAALGARTVLLDADLRDEEDAAGAAAQLGPVGALVADAAAAFTDAAAAGDAGELHALRSATDDAWSAVRAVANASWIGPQAPGRVVLLAPKPGDGPHAEPARAALENMARTLSVEWARHRITTVAITPGEATTSAQVAALVAYLVSPAGEYFSGCRLDLS